MVKEWPLIPIGQILEFKNGLNKGKEFFGHGTPIVNYTDVYHHPGLYSSDIKGKVCLSKDEIKRFEVRKNDVFFTRTSETPEEVGFSAVLLDDIEDCAFSGFVLRGRPKNDLLYPLYCKYCFATKAVREQIIKNCTYTTRALTNGRVLSAIMIPVPSIEEQRAIADTLTTMERYITDLAALIEKKKAIREGAVTDLMTGKTRLAGHTAPWASDTLGTIGTFTKGAPLSKAAITETGTPFILYGELYTTYGEVTYVVHRHTKQNAPADCISRVGDVIIPTSGETADEIATACCVMVPGVILAGDLNIYRAPEMDGRFISHVINHVINRKIAEIAQGISIIHINAKALGKMMISYPQLEEQSAIADVIDEMDTEINSLEAEREKMIQIREGAMNDLLTGRVRLSL